MFCRYCMLWKMDVLSFSTDSGIFSSTLVILAIVPLVITWLPKVQRILFTLYLHNYIFYILP